jgi:hypothetical protein
MPRGSRRWLILVHQLPPRPSNLRVRVWRRLQQVGAVVLRNSLYVLPATDDAREDFNWVRQEITSSGGQVSVLEAAAIDGYTDAELVQQFRKLRTADYEALAADIRAAASDKAAARTRLGKPGDQARVVRMFRERLAAIQARDYFNAAGRPIVEQALKDLVQPDHTPATAASTSTLRAADFRRRTWVTRPRPGIDRIACAWLIRRFIAPDAKFGFTANGQALRDGHVPFDMADVEFGHHGSDCTFETFMRRFTIADPGVVALSRVVHDLDLKDARFGMPEGAAVSRIVDGLRVAYSDDTELLEQGIVLMEALYQSFASEHRGRKRVRPKDRPVSSHKEHAS